MQEQTVVRPGRRRVISISRRAANGAWRNRAALQSRSCSRGTLEPSASRNRHGLTTRCANHSVTRRGKAPGIGARAGEVLLEIGVTAGLVMRIRRSQPPALWPVMQAPPWGEPLGRRGSPLFGSQA